MNKSLLIVDDDPINLKLFTIIAQKNNWDYDTAVDGYEVQNLLKTKSYALILLDIQLPGIDGFSLIGTIKESSPNTKIIAVTAYAMSGDKEKIMKAGADDYLSKPVNIEELIQRVEKALNIS